MGEYIYDDGSGVRIDRSTATIGGKTYSIPNINSVSVQMDTGDSYATERGCGTILLGGAALVVIGGLAGLANPDSAQVLGGSLFIALIAAGAGIYMFRKKDGEPSWRLIFTMSSGDVQAIWSYDQAHIERLRDAIEEAMRPAPPSTGDPA